MLQAKLIAKPEKCARACGGLIVRRWEEDAWYCVRCGWDTYDKPGTPLRDGIVRKEQEFPIGTGKYSGH